MALDEALLSSEGAFGRLYRWAAPAVTFGFSQEWSFVVAEAARLGYPGNEFVRRATGGGIVSHDGREITFSIVFPWERLSSPCFVYKNVHRGIHLGLKAIGVKTALKAGPAEGVPRPLEKACFTAPEPMDLLDDEGRKVLGGALRRKGTRGLYQGSLRIDTLGRPKEELEAAVMDGVLREFPDASFDPPDLPHDAAKYSSEAWNKRR